MARKFLAAILAHKDVAPLLSDEHFSVDGTLIEAWASMKSLKPKAGADGSEPPATGSGKESQAPVEAQVCEPAAPAKTPGGGQGPQCRSGLPRRETHERDARLRQRSRCPPLPQDRPSRITVGADKGFDTEDFVNELRSMNVTPHVAAKAKGSAIDGRTTRHAGYAVSQRIRKRIEEAFGWSKTVGPVAKTMLRGLDRVGGQFTLTLAAYNLARLPKLLAA